MSNSNAPCGFSPIRRNGGEIRRTPYSIASGYNTALGQGDPVQLTGTGTNIQVCAAGQVNAIGVFAGCEYTDAQGQRHWTDYWPANQTGTNIVAYVWDDPMQEFEIQADSAAAGDIGALADWVVGTPSATTKMSTTYLAVTGNATGTDSKGIRLMRLTDKPNNAYGAYAMLEVRFAEHALLTGAASAGGV
jgi:hypothetical protein